MIYVIVFRIVNNIIQHKPDLSPDVLRRNASFLFYLQMQENLGDLFGKHIY
jgi:hypothetical protein